VGGNQNLCFYLVSSCLDFLFLSCFGICVSIENQNLEFRVWNCVSTFVCDLSYSTLSGYRLEKELRRLLKLLEQLAWKLPLKIKFAACK